MVMIGLIKDLKLLVNVLDIVRFLYPLNLIRKDEHRSRSYYERKAVADGGIKASQERKERAIDVLIQDGQLELLPYDKPRGRATHYLQVIEIEEKGKYSVN